MKRPRLNRPPSERTRLKRPDLKRPIAKTPGTPQKIPPPNLNSQMLPDLTYTLPSRRLPDNAVQLLRPPAPSVQENPWPATRATDERQPTGKQHNEHVPCPAPTLAKAGNHGSPQGSVADSVRLAKSLHAPTTTASALLVRQGRQTPPTIARHRPPTPDRCTYGCHPTPATTPSARHRRASPSPSGIAPASGSPQPPESATNRSAAAS